MIYFIPVYGLANRMRALDSAVSLCREKNIQLKVYWVKDTVMNCAFTDLFEPIPEIEIIEKDKPFIFDMASNMNLFSPWVYKYLQNWVILDQHDVKSLSKNDFDFSILGNKRTLMASYLRFYSSERMFEIFTPLSYLQQQILQESDCFSQNTIGIHIRRTDNKKSIFYSPTELFEQAIDQEIDLNQDVHFYLASDCIVTKKRLKTKYKERISTNFKPTDRTTKEGIQQALVELYTLSHTKKIYGSYWSSFSHTAAHIGGIEEITLKINGT